MVWGERRQTPYAVAKEACHKAIQTFMNDSPREAGDLSRLTQALVRLDGHIINIDGHYYDSDKHDSHLMGSRALISYLLSPEAMARPDRENVWNCLFVLSHLAYDTLENPVLVDHLAEALAKDPLCLDPKGPPACLVALAIEKMPPESRYGLIETMIAEIERESAAGEFPPPPKAPIPGAIARPMGPPTVLRAIFEASPSFTDRIIDIACKDDVLSQSFGKETLQFFRDVGPYGTDHYGIDYSTLRDAPYDEKRLRLIGTFNRLLRENLQHKRWRVDTHETVWYNELYMDMTGRALCTALFPQYDEEKLQSLDPFYVAEATKLIEENKSLVTRYKDEVVVPPERQPEPAPAPAPTARSERSPRPRRPMLPEGARWVSGTPGDFGVKLNIGSGKS